MGLEFYFQLLLLAILLVICVDLCQPKSKHRHHQQHNFQNKPVGPAIGPTRSPPIVVSQSSISCILPNHQSNGVYVVSNVSIDYKTVPGNKVPLFTTLTYSCEPGYDNEEKSSMCKEDGTWSLTPVCKRKSQWGTPDFIHVKPRKEVEYRVRSDNNFLEIIMEEEIEGEVILALLNYKGENVPELIANLTKGQNIVLGAEIRAGDEIEGKKWYLVIKNRQDFEGKYTKRHNTRLTVITGWESRQVFVTIRNIQDLPPEITGMTCHIPEFYVGITNCTYVVTTHGFNIHSYSIIPRQGVEHKLFGITNKTIQQHRNVDGIFDEKVEIKLKSLQRLEHDINRLYIFAIAANLSESLQGRITAVIQVQKLGTF